MLAIERKGEGPVQVLPLLATAVAALVECCRILVMLGVDILLTSRPTLLDRILNVCLCRLDVLADLRAVGTLIYRRRSRS